MTRTDVPVEPPLAVPPGPGTEGLTERGRRTRARLVQAARRIFERDGFLAARITDIAEEAEVAHGTFYTYFDSKEAAFREVILELEADMLGGTTGPDDEAVDPLTSIAAANRRFLEVYRANSALMASCEQAASCNADFALLLKEGTEWFVQRNERALRALQAQGLADAGLDARYAAHALTGMVGRCAHDWFTQGEPFELDQAVEQLTRLWANAIGLRIPPARPRRRKASSGTSRASRASRA